MSAKRIFTGTAGVYYVMYQLAARGFHASCTHGNAPNLDILVSSEDGERILAIQVKTTEWATRERGRGEERKPAKLDFPLGHKGGKLNKPNVFFAFVDLNGNSEGREVAVYLVPSKWLFDFCKGWIDTRPMARFQPTIDQVARFRNAWDQVAAVVGTPKGLESDTRDEEQAGQASDSAG
jgi:hypothetical protein